jgi:trimeric autotransporter adhesin
MAMKNLNGLQRVKALSALVSTTSLVVACGGGGGSDAPTPTPSAFTVTGKAADGPLQGVTACYDSNDNQACDSGEPVSAATGADGSFTIANIAPADIGKHRVIVDVPASAIDADTGQAVGAAFTMAAPATGATGDHSVFVSPLTTLVQQQMETSGQTAAQSSDFIKSLLGLEVSPLADFTAAANSDNAKIANAAKLVLQVQRQQAAAVASAVGQTDISGAAITQTDLDRAVLAGLVEALPSIGAVASDAAVLALTGTAREQQLTAAAASVVAQLGLTPDQARFAIGLRRLPALPPQSSTPTAGASLVALQYTNAANWFMRANQSTALDNTPDANGLVKFFDVRTRMAPYAYQPDQGVAESFTRTTNPELFWNGSSWTQCNLGDRFTSTVRDALGRNSYNYCDNNEKGTGQRAEIDISGQTLAGVWTDKLLPEAAKTTSPGNWSLPDVGLLGTAVFPSGSRMNYNSNTTTETAITYNTIATSRVDVAPLAVAQGGDARSGSPACATDASRELLGTLETLVARNLGLPCIFSQQTNDANGTSLSPNEVWGTSTVSLGTLATNVARPAGTSNYYTANRLLRVSFPSAGNTVYWSCLQRTTNNASRNCAQIGSGTYTIATLGDARVMTFNNLPADAQGLNSTRVFVERGGAIYFGFKNKVGSVTTRVQFNLTAANALLRQLGMPPIAPADAPKPLTGAAATVAATLKGVWGGTETDGANIIRFGDNGAFLMGQARPPTGAGRPGIERGWLDFDPATGASGRLLEVDSNGDTGTSHPGPDEGITGVSATAISVAGGSIPRFVDDPAGIVGMWALGSATDLKATHFVFFANGKVLSIHPAETQGACATARQGPPGVEWSDYSFNAATGALRIFNKIYDTSGCTGAFDSADAAPNTEANFVLTMAGDKKTFTFPGDGGAILTGYRIAPN